MTLALITELASVFDLPSVVDPSPPPHPLPPPLFQNTFLPLCMTCEQFVSVICIYLPGVVTFLFVRLFLFQGVFLLLFVWLFALSAVGGGGLVILFTTLKLVCHFDVAGRVRKLLGKTRAGCFWMLPTVCLW